MGRRGKEGGFYRKSTDGAESGEWGMSKVRNYLSKESFPDSSIWFWDGYNFIRWFCSIWFMEVGWRWLNWVGVGLSLVSISCSCSAKRKMIVVMRMVRMERRNGLMEMCLVYWEVFSVLSVGRWERESGKGKGLGREVITCVSSSD